MSARSLRSVLCAAGCRFDPSLPGGLTLTCHDNSECPQGQFCLVAESRCIAATDDGKAPGIVAGSRDALHHPASGRVPAGSVAAALAPAGHALVGFAVTEPLTVPPVLDGSTPLQCTVLTGTASPAQLESALAAPEVTEGPVTLTVTLVNLTGTRADVVLDGVHRRRRHAARGAERR